MVGCWNSGILGFRGEPVFLSITIEYLLTCYSNLPLFHYSKGEPNELSAIRPKGSDAKLEKKWNQSFIK